jgi:hypothetical protein
MRRCRFQLRGYRLSIDAYPAPVVPVGDYAGDFVALYDSMGGHTFTPIDPKSKWVRLPNWPSDLGDFNASTERLFAFGPSLIMSVPRTEEAAFYQTLLRNRRFSAEDPFLRLALAEIARSPAILKAELAQCVEYLRQSDPEVVEPWYRAACASIAELDWSPGALPSEWSGLPSDAFPPSLSVLVVRLNTVSRNASNWIIERLKLRHLNGDTLCVEDGGQVDSQMRSGELLAMLGRVCRSKAVVFLENGEGSGSISVRVLDHAIPDQSLDPFLEGLEPVGEDLNALPFEVALRSIFERQRSFQCCVARVAGAPQDDPVSAKAGLLKASKGEKLNCRTVPADLWEHARRALVFYFNRRVPADAEDLAQTTLLALWNRPDYEFERSEDFLRVCYAFADNISKSAFRERLRHQADELPPNLTQDGGGYGLTQSELRQYLNEVLHNVAVNLPDEIGGLIRSIAEDSGSPAGQRTLTGNLRVKLHRARKKLAALTGWRTKGR